jgi:transglutaminase superfamily protein
MLRRIDVPTLRAALWTLRALRTTRAQLRCGQIDGLRIPPPPPLPEGAARGVRAILRRRPNTCLERSLVLQRWIGTFGDAPDVIVGVSGPSGAFRAHAWLEGEPDGADQPFHELLRLPGAANV